MATEYTHKRRVQFYETDAAGIVHFSWFFRYMEEAEHALWRAAGMSIDSPSLGPASSGAASNPNKHLKWPRVAAAFDFKRPLRFEDEFEVHVGIAAVSTRTIQYNHTVKRGDITIGVGTVTAACVQIGADHILKSVEIPPDILTRLREQLVT